MTPEQFMNEDGEIILKFSVFEKSEDWVSTTVLCDYRAETVKSKMVSGTVFLGLNIAELFAEILEKLDEKN